jgi:hypothetical protein
MRLMEDLSEQEKAAKFLKLTLLAFYLYFTCNAIVWTRFFAADEQCSI